MDAFGGLDSNATPVESAAAVMDSVRQEAAVNNARQIVEKVNQQCFDKCIPKPGSSLSRGEQTCLTQCMEKYMAAWDAVSRQYLGRLQREKGRVSL
ncbi:MAG: protein translocase subunit [Thelocarpon superellum]|nr:MAG: protein translocase subunit [Thelocarpon superellum]